MRDIKFRQYDKIRNEFFYWGFGVDEFIFTSPLMNRDTSAVSKSEQYTGLKDKNGNDIWEGDILIVSEGELNPPVCKIVWDDGEWRSIDKNGFPFDFRNSFAEIEIVGNVSENEDLLNE